MLASHDVFSHTGPPTAKIKRGGLVCIASHNARFLTGVTILYHTATGVLFLLAVLLFVCGLNVELRALLVYITGCCVPRKDSLKVEFM